MTDENKVTNEFKHKLGEVTKDKKELASGKANEIKGEAKKKFGSIHVTFDEEKLL